MPMMRKDVKWLWYCNVVIMYSVVIWHSGVVVTCSGLGTHMLSAVMKWRVVNSQNPLAIFANASRMQVYQPWIFGPPTGENSLVHSSVICL